MKKQKERGAVRESSQFWLKEVFSWWTTNPTSKTIEKLLSAI
jgi:hypothetical protein